MPLPILYVCFFTICNLGVILKISLHLYITGRHHTIKILVSPLQHFIQCTTRFTIPLKSGNLNFETKPADSFEKRNFKKINNKQDILSLRAFYFAVNDTNHHNFRFQKE